ncbi:MAG: hypothetical protein P4M08_15210 [Oligoflexia bacterium]|nr:hypothetical protein [Oligoflexia bacterium]
MSQSQSARDKSATEAAPNVDVETRDEIDKILSEVEELRKELSGETTPTEAESPLGEKASASAEDISIEETLAALPESEAEGETPFGESDLGVVVDMKKAASQLARAPSHIQGSNSMKPVQASSSPGTLSMTLSGSMTLKLKYEFDGQEVTVGFADQFLQIALADGTEFKIPVGSRASETRKKSA